MSRVLFVALIGASRSATANQSAPDAGPAQAEATAGADDNGTDDNGTDDNGEAVREAVSSSEPCPLTSTLTGVLGVTRQPELCDAGGRNCRQDEVFTVNHSDGTELLRLSNLRSPNGESEIAPLAVSCNAGVVEVTSQPAPGRPSPLILQLRFDTRAGALTLQTPLRELSGWNQPALTGAAAAQREQLARSLEQVIAGKAAPAAKTKAVAARHGLAQECNLLASLWALVARDQVEAGTWKQAEATLGHAEAIAAQSPLALEKARLVQVQKLLVDRRRLTVPIKVLQRRSLGTSVARRPTPLEPGERASLFFWQNEVCVQEEAGDTRELRCYSPTRKRWGVTVPSQRPPRDARALTVLEFSGREVKDCTGEEHLALVWPRELRSTHIRPCELGYSARRDDVLAVLENGKVLVALGGNEFALVQANAKLATLDLAKANELVRHAAGGRLVGEGCCVLGPRGQLRRLTGNAEQEWQLLGEAPPGEVWSGTPLASPDQGWLVAQSKGARGVTLWLFQIARVEPH